MSRKQICRQAQEYYREGRLVLGWEERLGNDVEMINGEIHCFLRVFSCVSNNVFCNMCFASRTHK